jgi:hypothetical protein
MLKCHVELLILTFSGSVASDPLTEALERQLLSFSEKPQLRLGLFAI